MKRNTLITSIVLIVAGFVTARIGDGLSTINESGMVQDSMLMPIGAILFVLGFLVLFVTIVWYLIDFIRSRVKKS
jgi:uncharacterized membrane protein YidH (DUF202 family)